MRAFQFREIILTFFIENKILIAAKKRSNQKYKNNYNLQTLQNNFE